MRIIRNFVTTLYLLLMIPIGFVGMAAWSDYAGLDCPDANQCSDALSVGVTTLVLAAVGLLIVVAFWFAAPGVTRREREDA